MVNRPLPTSWLQPGVVKAPAESKADILRKNMATRVSRALAQILAKFDFFDLRENLQRILLDYAQNVSHPANAPFNARC